MRNHPLSNIHPDAQIADNVIIEPFVTIEKDVVIGEGCKIASYACIKDGTRLGKNCQIFNGAIIGTIPQDLKFNGENTTLEIGDNVIIREFCTINRGTKASGTTIIKEGSLLMAYVHVAHDCIIGRNSILANCVNIAGHVTVGDFAILGGITAVHQFVNIGAHCMVSGGSLVRKDVPPFIKAAREPLTYMGVNSIGLKRRQFSPKAIKEIQDIYRILYVKGHNTSQAVNIIQKDFDESVYKNTVLNFINNASRGIIRGARKKRSGDSNGR